MKIRRSFWIVLVVFLFAALLIPVMGATAQGAVKVPVVIVEYLEGSGDGEVTFPGGNFHARGLTHETIEVSENPCVNGPGFIEYKVNVNKNGHVYVGGIWVIEPLAYEDEGTWELTWHLTTDKPIVAVGQGTGVFNGLSVEFTHTGGGVDDNGEYMIFEGEILVPPNSQVQCTE